MKVAYTDGSVCDMPDPLCECDGKVEWVLHYLDGAPDRLRCFKCLVEEIQTLDRFMVSRYDPNFILPLVDMMRKGYNASSTHYCPQ